jgi:hypothetical protein
MQPFVETRSTALSRESARPHPTTDSIPEDS